MRKDNRRRDSRTILNQINPNVAGVACGAAAHFVAVSPDRDPQWVRRFGTFTADLRALVDWLVTCGVTSVAMEATGVYWIPIYELLEARGLDVLLVNARHVKNVPGRKSDVSDCEWLRDLHSVGLLRGSFRPTEAVVALRTYVRHRQTVIETASTAIQRIQKALAQMNVQLALVVSDITGTTGLRIIRDILAGERDPARLARHRDVRCRATTADIVAALTGHYRDDYLFVVQQQLAVFDLCQQQIVACDRAIERQLHRLTVDRPITSVLPAARQRRRITPKNNDLAFDARPALFQLTGGVDLTQIDGIGPLTAVKLLAEIGTDMQRWRTEKHFTSWLTLAPRNRITGERLVSSRTQPSANRAAGILRMVAMSLGRTQTALGAFYRRLAVRIGKPQAITATARKLAVLVYRALKGELVYADPGADHYNAAQRARVVRRLRQRAAALGFELVDRATGEVLAAGVS